MEIIPAIDIIEGKCVRLEKGDFSSGKVYNENPLEVAKQFADAGLKRLHLVDLDGARTGSVKNWKVLEKLAGRTNLVIDFSGGISNDDDIRICFNSGASIAAVGSIAVKNEELLMKWVLTYGKERFIIGADVKNKTVAIKGWTESGKIQVEDLVEKYISKGMTTFFCTDISKDGMLDGPAYDLYEELLERFEKIRLIASGGVTTIDDVVRLAEKKLSGVIIGKAIYEKRISLTDLKMFVQS